MTRLFDGGRVMPHHVRNAGTVRGLLTIKQEDDHVRHRTTLVARFAPQHQIGSRVVPPLYDVVLIASTGEVWTLVGISANVTDDFGNVTGLSGRC